MLLRRSPGELQVGLEPSVVVPAAYGPLVRRLVGGASTDTLARVARADGLHPAELTDLLAALEGARLLQPDSVAAGRAVRLVGAGPLASRTAHELVSAGFGTVYLADLPAREPLEPRTGTGTGIGDRPRRRPAGRLDRADLLVAALTGTAPGLRVRRTRHFVKPEGDAVALTVVVADGPEPDRLVTDLLREHAAPHLLVRSSGDEAAVGPLVVPGATSCVRCADLARRDADPRWPWLLDQLTRLEIEPVPTLATWAAVTATVQVLAFVTGGTPETLGHTLELGTADHTMRLRTWTPHPECPCRWDETAGVTTNTV